MEEGYSTGLMAGRDPASALGAAGLAPADLLPRRLRSAVDAHVLPSLIGRNAAGCLSRSAALPFAASANGQEAVMRLVELLEHDTGSAHEDFVLDFLDRGIDPQELARTLLEPAARAVGTAWCEDTQDFVRVTFAVSRLQRIFWRITTEQPPLRCPDPQRLALLAPAPGEQHTFGLSVVEDALRRAGWEVDCCRAGEETEMFRLVATNHYRFVGLSLSGEALLPAFASAIRKLRGRSRNPSLAVVAGGSLFARRPDLGLAAGADFVGDSARSVVDVAERILAADRPHTQVCVAAE